MTCTRACFQRGGGKVWARHPLNRAVTCREMTGQSHLRIGQDIWEGPGAELDEVALRYSSSSVVRKGSMSHYGKAGGSSGCVERRPGIGGTKKCSLRAVAIGS